MELENTLIYSSQDVVKIINQKGEQIVGKIISDTIEAHKTVASKLQSNYARYSTDAVPIMKRSNSSENNLAADKRINNDFAGDIVDQIKGFVFGEKIKTVYPEASGNSKINEFITENSLEALDTELAEFMLSSGYGSRLFYVEAGTGIVKAINTKPWQTVFIINDSTEEVDYAMIYYDWAIVNPGTGKAIKTIRVEWYDKENVSYFIKQGGKYILEQGEIFENGEIVTLKNPQPHLFDFVPVVKYKPNPREQSAFAKVESLIDSYDISLSDWLNEIIEFRNAYLVATGGTVDEEEKKRIKKSGMINLPDKDAKMEFLVKNLNPDFIDKFLKIVEGNTYKFSKTVNMNDEKFMSAGAESGEARKWKLLALFFEGIVIERYFTKALRQQYKILCSAWNKGSLSIDYRKIEFTFTRKLPVDLLYAAQILTNMFGKVPIEEIYKLMPFIDNPAELAKKFQDENNVNLDNVPLPPNNQPNNQPNA
jgi:SPP1 family phage portal protein